MFSEGTVGTGWVSVNTGWAMEARGRGRRIKQSWVEGLGQAGAQCCPGQARAWAGAAPTQAWVHVAGPGTQFVLITERLALQNPAQANGLGTSVRAHRPAPFWVSPTVLTQVLVSMPRCRRNVNRATAVMGVPQVKMSVSES